jgi:PST family polysaccharide transporter
VADGYGALVHGMRRIADMARADLLAAFVGSVFAIGLVAALHEDGVALSLLAIAAMSALTSWWMSRRAGLPRWRCRAPSSAPRRGRCCAWAWR